MKKIAPILFLIILFGGAIWYSLTQQPDPVHELPPPPLPTAVPAESSQAGAQEAASDQYTESEPVLLPEPLPLLNESDGEVKQALGEILGQDLLAQYLVKDQVISRFVVAIDSLSSRQVPAQINPVTPAADKFIVYSEGENVVLSEQNFARYDGYIGLLENTDATVLVHLYQRYKPLFQEAWEENGGEGSFNERLYEVIELLLETPDVPGPIYLVKPEAVYLFAEPELEALTAGQKILIRMGSANAAVVKEKLQEIKTNQALTGTP